MSYAAQAPAAPRSEPEDTRRPRPVWQPEDPPEEFAPIELSPKVLRHLQRIDYEGTSKLHGRVFRIPSWKSWPMERRLAFLRDFVEDTSRDPAIVEKATRILKKAGAQPSNHREQWAALLKWVQRNVYYVNERDERFQSPQQTLTVAAGDCDDLGILLSALGDSLRLPWRFTISGRDKRTGRLIVYVEGTGPVPSNVEWSHIFVQVGGPPFRPNWWTFAEPTLSVPLGWNVGSRRAVAGRADLAGAHAGLGDAVAGWFGDSGEASPAATTTALTKATTLAKTHGPKILTTAITSTLSLVLVDFLMRALGRRRKRKG